MTESSWFLGKRRQHFPPHRAGGCPQPRHSALHLEASSRPLAMSERKAESCRHFATERRPVEAAGVATEKVRSMEQDARPKALLVKVVPDCRWR